MGLLRLFFLPAFLAFAAAASFGAHAAALPGFDELEKSLRLDPAQKAQFDTAVAATRRALLSVAFGGLQLKERIAEEFSKPKPDLGALARAQEDAIEQSRPLFAEARREWERLYAMLDPAQVRRVRAAVEEKLRGLERIGEALRGMLGEGKGDGERRGR